MSVEKTETPRKTTQTRPKRTTEKTTERTTKHPYDRAERSRSDNSSENWKIGLSVGVVLFVLSIAIGKCVVAVKYIITGY